MGNRFFSKVQYGKESAVDHGTPVAADTIWVGQAGPMTSDRQVAYPVEQFGVRAEANRSVIGQYLVKDTLSSEHGTFQQLAALLGCGVKGGVTAVEQHTGQGDYLYDFTPSLTSANSPDSLTIEKGDDVQAWEAEYCMFDRIALSGQANQDNSPSPVSLEGGFFGRQWTETSFTGAISLPNTEPLVGILSHLYIDTEWSGVGGTEKTGLLRDFSLEILPGVHPVFHGGSSRTFDAHAEGIIGLTASFTLEGTSVADAIWDAKQAQTFQVVRFELRGSQIGTGDNHSFIVDMGGTWQDVIPMANDDRGDNLHTAVFGAHYDSVGAKLLQFLLTTDLAAY